MNQDVDIYSIIQAAKYASQYRGKTFLIKLGGSVLHDAKAIQSLCEDLQVLREAGIHIVIVHGGSKAINEALAIYQVPSKFIDGLRVTTSQAMNIIEMVLCRQVNSLLVRTMNSIGVQAVGLSGIDDNMLLCEQLSQQHGYVGRIQQANVDLINQLLKASLDIIPIIAPVGVNAMGQAMNINADYAASRLARALKVDKLIYMTDQDGIYDQSGKIYSQLDQQQLQQLIDDKVVQGGMLTKVKSILSVLESGLNHIHILNGNQQHSLIGELFTKQGIGTLCKNTQNYCEERSVKALQHQLAG